MLLANSIVAAEFSLAATLCWGTSDFLGGYGSRRANAVLLTAVAHASGAALMAALALLTHSAFPSQTAVLWSLAAGLSGGGALALFYRALATGRMGLTAPVAAVLGAAVPVIFGMAHDGPPGLLPILGFLLAAIGIWLISRVEDSHRPEGIGMALLSGLGFAGYFLLTRQAGNESAFWIACLARCSAFVLTGGIVLFAGSYRHMDGWTARFGTIAGCVDVTGSWLYIRASQSGRLDSAVVISSLYPAITVLLARFFLDEHFTRWKAIGMAAALLAVPLIALR